MKIPRKPPKLQEILKKQSGDPVDFLVKMGQSVRDTTFNNQYIHWDELRLKDLPKDTDIEEIWAGLKFRRMGNRKDIPLEDKAGSLFSYCTPDYLQESLAYIDRHASGKIQTADQITNSQTRNRYIISSLMEEAIRSSQLEGAATTRKAAKEMIRTGRAPIDKNERMIYNNYLTMQHIRKITDKTLQPSTVLDIHKKVTKGTLDDPDEAGRLRKEEDGFVRVVQNNDGLILHDPPSAEELPKRLSGMCDFANKKIPDSYLHPVLRAIILHFWLSYDHPFTDGNGRTARALFYWLMLREGYWLCEFISISHVLRNAPSKYARSFLYTETDDNDLTYFLIYNLRVIRKAINELFQYIEKKETEITLLENRSRKLLKLNHRQKALISHALRNPDGVYTFASHKQSHGVSFQTARTDLLSLEKSGYLVKEKIGRAYHFYPAKNLTDKLA